MSGIILITGARGTIGTQTRKALQAKGVSYEVTTSSADRPIEGEQNRVLNFDDPSTFASALKGVDKLFLLQPLRASMSQELELLIKAAEQAGVSYVLRSSGGGAETDSDYALMKSHGEADQVLKNSNLKYTIARPTNFNQNFINYYAGMVQGGSLYLATGEGKIPFVDTRDLGEAYAEILSNSEEYYGKTLNLNGPSFLTGVQVASRFSEILGRKVQAVLIPEEAQVASLKEMGLDQTTIEFFASLSRFTREYQNERYANDLQNILGKELRTFEDFVSENKGKWSV